MFCYLALSAIGIACDNYIFILGIVYFCSFSKTSQCVFCLDKWIWLLKQDYAKYLKQGFTLYLSLSVCSSLHFSSHIDMHSELYTFVENILLLFQQYHSPAKITATSTCPTRGGKGAKCCSSLCV